MRVGLAVFQFTREEQPAFSGSNEALAMVVVAVRLREVLFGHRSAVGRREHYTTPVTLTPVTLRGRPQHSQGERVLIAIV
jgi:hypothetical protein